MRIVDSAEKKQLYDQGRALINKHIYGGNDVVTVQEQENRWRIFRDYELGANGRRSAQMMQRQSSPKVDRRREDLTEEEQSQCPTFPEPPPYYTEDLAACFQLAASGANTEATVTTSNSSSSIKWPWKHSITMDVELLHATTSWI